LTKMPSGPGRVLVTCIDYSPDQFQIQEVTDLDAFLAQHRPAWSAVRWINVDGLTDMRVLRSLAEKYQLHPLAVEDVLHVHQRPKVESYNSGADDLPRLYVVLRMIEL